MFPLFLAVWRGIWPYVYGVSEGEWRLLLLPGPTCIRTDISVEISLQFLSCCRHPKSPTSCLMGWAFSVLVPLVGWAEAFARNWEPTCNTFLLCSSFVSVISKTQIFFLTTSDVYSSFRFTKFWWNRNLASDYRYINRQCAKPAFSIFVTWTAIWSKKWFDQLRLRLHTKTCAFSSWIVPPMPPFPSSYRWVIFRCTNTVLKQHIK